LFCCSGHGSRGTKVQMKSAMAFLFAVLCVPLAGALKTNVLEADSEAIPLDERRTFKALPGNGWCVDASGHEGTARTKSLRMSCAAAQQMCAKDDMCVAFACVQQLKMAVLYTNNNCEHGCDVMKWLIHPDAIAKSGYDSHNLDMAAWKQGVCYVDERARHGHLVNEKTDTTNCDFEKDTCGWTVKGLYKWKTEFSTAHSAETGPHAAHSGVGFLVAGSSSSLSQEKTFELISPFLGEDDVTGKQSILYFWYSMDGASMGNLELWCDAKDGRAKLWEKIGNQGHGWRKAMVEVPPTQCRFKAITAGTTSDIAIDDVVFVQTQANRNCNFNDNLCAWEIASAGWQRTKGATDSGDTGPTNGAGGADSSYLYVEASGQNYPSKTFELKSAEFLTHEGANLKFKYNMHGAKMGTLKVDVVFEDGSVQTKWEKLGEQNNDPAEWLEAQVAIPAAAKQIKFVGITGLGDKSDMAIDDVEFEFKSKY